MRQEFLEQLENAGHNKEKLIKLMADIDAEKRSVKSFLSQLSSEPDHQLNKGKERQIRIRKLKDKISFLTEEREIVRSRIGEIKKRAGDAHRVTHGKKHGYTTAFLIAAEEILDEKTLLEIEAKAAIITEQLENQK